MTDDELRTLKYAVSRADLEEYISSVSNNYQLYNMVAFYRDSFMIDDTITEENKLEKIKQFLCAIFLFYNEILSFKELRTTNMNIFEKITDMFLSTAAVLPLSEDKILKKIPNVYYGLSSVKMGYSTYENIEEEFRRIYDKADPEHKIGNFIFNNVLSLAQFIRDDGIPEAKLFLNINDEKAEIEESPGLLSFIYNYNIGSLALIRQNAENYFGPYLNEVKETTFYGVILDSPSITESTILELKEILIKVIEEINKGTINY